jgi:hypothetical protein
MDTSGLTIPFSRPHRWARATPTIKSRFFLKTPFFLKKKSRFDRWARALAATRAGFLNLFFTLNFFFHALIAGQGQCRP